MNFKPGYIEDGMKGLVAWGEKEEAKDKFEEAHEELLRRGLVEEQRVKNSCRVVIGAVV